MSLIKLQLTNPYSEILPLNYTLFNYVRTERLWKITCFYDMDYYEAEDWAIYLCLLTLVYIILWLNHVNNFSSFFTACEWWECMDWNWRKFGFNCRHERIKGTNILFFGRECYFAMFLSSLNRQPTNHPTILVPIL